MTFSNKIEYDALMQHSKKTLSASHVAVGSELTSGQTLNTNSHFIAGILQKKGVLNNYHLIVPDNKDMIKKVLDLCAAESDWIFVYGGLGPTTDDFTRNVVAEWANLNLEFHEPTWTYIQNYLSGRNYPVREFQRQQAYFPKGSTIMENSKGTAHGFCFPWKDKMFVVWPGPPMEIQSIYENFLNAFIDKNTQNLNQWLTYTWNTIGLGESEVANKIEQEIKNFNIEVGYRVHIPYVEVKISFFKEDLEKNQNLISNVDRILAPLLAYKQEAPFKDFFQNLFSSVREFAIYDDYTQGLVYEDFKKWGISFTNKNFTYKNYIQTPDVENYFLLQKISAEKIRIETVVNKKTLQFELDPLPVIKLPIERQILYIKEKFYLHLLKNL